MKKTCYKSCNIFRFVYIFLMARTNAVLDPNNYIVNQNFCTVDLAQSQKQLELFAPRWGPPPPVVVHGEELWVSYPMSRTLAYGYEGARYNETQCSFCPYSGSPEVLIPEYLGAGGVRNQHTPMYGPCLNGAASTKMPCVQNQILYPPDFVGEYYFPDQRLADPTLFSFPYFTHEWIEGTFSTSITNSPDKSPSTYGLGKGNAMANIQTLRVMNNATGTENTTLSALMQAPYLVDSATGNERWGKWEQHFCRQGCHRDSQRQIVTVRASDYREKSPTLAYLNRRINANEPLALVRCAQCPQWQTGYNWGGLGDPSAASPPSQNLVAFDCYPWFGSVPVLITKIPGVVSFNVTKLLNHSTANDGVSHPPVNGYIEGRVCPPNTYNDVCAHKFRYEVPNPYASSGQQPVCKPCAAGGWHTGGRSGAWFCLPPGGQTMSLPDPWDHPLESPLRTLMNIYRDSATNQSLLWARRDILGVEFECGSTPAHCYQCAKANLGPNAVPEDFNREIILKNLLIWSNCPSSFYCPASSGSLEAPVPCPPLFPWSPTGSSSIGNCTCARGTYLRKSGPSCAPCGDPSSCSIGQFMSGWTRCAKQDGATSPGVCVGCTNLPPNNANYSGAGKEAIINDITRGVCPFVCGAGMRLTGSKTCASDYTCSPLIFTTAVYSSGLTNLRDGFIIFPRCDVQSNLTNAALNKNGWPAVSTSCANANPNCADNACKITRNASYDGDYVCAQCPPSEHGYYFVRPLTGENAIIASYSCRVRCNTNGYYFNETANECQSCATFEAAYCPSSQYHISGGGCYGSLTPFGFPMTNPAAIANAMCVECALSMPPPLGKWISLLDAPCAEKPCSTPYGLGISMYVQTPCGNTSDVVVLACTISCSSPDFYLKGICQSTSTGICTACTKFLPGSYLIANCTNQADTEWAKCSIPGTYCPGDGSVAKCPANQSSSPGAVSPANCYCPIGTVSSLYEATQCIPFSCDLEPISSSFFIAPGASIASKSYMGWDEENQKTKCILCPDNSLSILNDNIGIQSCMCPSSLNAENAVGYRFLQSTCVACPSSATIASLSSDSCPFSIDAYLYYGGIPDTCWRGIEPVAECVCIPPPFSLVGEFTPCSPSSMCPGGFDIVKGNSGGQRLLEVSHPLCFFYRIAQKT